MAFDPPIDPPIDPREVARRAARRALAERARQEAGSAPGPGIHVDVRPSGTEGGTTPPHRPDAGSPRAVDGPERQLVTAECLLGHRDGAEVDLPRGAIVTALARDEAARRGIRLVEPGDPCPAAPTGPLRIAVGADHGGFPLKVELLDWIRSLGHTPVDLGTTGTAAVDYPDFAGAVAEAVADGVCDLGICIDGAGIGSAMAANKVPGVRAANCWDPASARNAREHNYANVLCLGGPRLERPAALEILETFLNTPWGAERHGRRVAKITRIEERYARTPRTTTTETRR